jgi:hypothetical protein
VSSEPRSQPTEDELRAAYEEEIKRIRVEQVLLENIVTLVNLGMRRTGMVAGTEPERDAGQVRIAIESVRALMPLVDEVAPEQANAIRQALSQLQLAYVQIGGSGPAHPRPPGSTEPAGSDPARPTPESAPAPGTAARGSGPGAPEAEPEPIRPGEPGPAERSGRLWVPGQ